MHYFTLYLSYKVSLTSSPTPPSSSLTLAILKPLSYAIADQIGNLTVPFPPLSEQDASVHVRFSVVNLALANVVTTS